MNGNEKSEMTNLVNALCDYYPRGWLQSLDSVSVAIAKRSAELGYLRESVKNPGWFTITKAGLDLVKKSLNK